MKKPELWFRFMGQHGYRPSNIDKVAEIEKHLKYNKLPYSILPYTGKKPSIKATQMAIHCPDCDIILTVKNMHWVTTKKKYHGMKTKRGTSMSTLIDSAKQRMSQHKTLDKVIAEKRERKYNKATKANIMFKLKQAEKYLEQGNSRSKAARLADIEYETFKKYLDNPKSFEPVMYVNK